LARTTRATSRKAPPASSSLPVIHQAMLAPMKAGRKNRSVPTMKMMIAPATRRASSVTIMRMGLPMRVSRNPSVAPQAGEIGHA